MKNNNINTMSKADLNKTERQLEVVKELMTEFSGKTLDNIQRNLEQRIKYYNSIK